MSRSRQFSFYPVLCIGLIPDDGDDLEPMNLTENETGTLTTPGAILMDDRLVRFYSTGPGRYGLGVTLFLLWDEPTTRWLAFAASHITTDFYDETNYARACAPNALIWKLVLDTFGVPATPEVMEKVGQLSPAALRALACP